MPDEAPKQPPAIIQRSPKWSALTLWASGVCKDDRDVAQLTGCTVADIALWKRAADPVDWYAFADEVQTRTRAVALASAVEAADSARALPTQDERVIDSALKTIQLRALKNLAMAEPPDTLTEILRVSEGARAARGSLRKRAR